MRAAHLNRPTDARMIYMHKRWHVRLHGAAIQQYDINAPTLLSIHYIIWPLVIIAVVVKNTQTHHYCVIIALPSSYRYYYYSFAASHLDTPRHRVHHRSPFGPSHWWQLCVIKTAQQECNLNAHFCQLLPPVPVFCSNQQTYQQMQ